MLWLASLRLAMVSMLTTLLLLRALVLAGVSWRSVAVPPNAGWWWSNGLPRTAEPPPPIA